MIAEGLLVSDKSHAAWLRWSVALLLLLFVSSWEGKEEEEEEKEEEADQEGCHDVPVLMQVMLQQSLPVEFVKVPQLRFIDRLWIFQLCHGDGRAQGVLRRKSSIFHTCSPVFWVDDVLVNMQRQVPRCLRFSHRQSAGHSVTPRCVLTVHSCAANRWDSIGAGSGGRRS